MPIPKNKSELLSTIEKTYSLLRSDILVIPDRYYQNVSMVGHKKETLMSPENLVAYLIGWAELVIHWHHEWKEQKEVIFPHKNYKWTELGDLAQYFYMKYPSTSKTAHIVQLDQSVQAIKQIIEEATNDELYAVLWYKNYTRGRMIQLNTSSPYKNARSRIRKWMKIQLLS